MESNWTKTKKWIKDLQDGISLDPEIATPSARRSLPCGSFSPGNLGSSTESDILAKRRAAAKSGIEIIGRM